MRFTFLALVVPLLGVQHVSTQILESIELGSLCTMFGDATPGSLTLFAPDKQAQDAVGRILGTVGLERNFEIRAAGVPNAAAEIKGTRRFIFYSQTFFERTKATTGSDWAPVSILAHEIAHHLQGHTLDRVGSRPKEELEADSWSGFVLQKMGASLEEAQLAMTKLGTDGATDSHPAKHDRLAAIANGWRRSCEADAACRSGRATPSEPPRNADVEAELERLMAEERRPKGPDSCEYANDGECDEPNMCAAGTDTTDCRAPRTRIATTCVTILLSCPMGVQIPVGSPCYCPTLFGPVTGVAQ